MTNKAKTLTEAYESIYETKASEDRLDNLAKLHKLGAKMSDAEAAYVVIKDALNSPDGKRYEGDYIAVGRELKDGGMSRDEYSLETLQKALEYAKQDGWEFDIEAILDQLGGPVGHKEDYEREEHQDDEHRGWPGDGTGEDDFQDYNEREADDYYNESKSLNEAYKKVFDKNYEDKLDKKEAYKSSLLRQDEDLLARLEAKGRSSSANETQQTFNNIAQQCHTLLTGGEAGPEYSGIEINNEQRKVITQIAELVLSL